MKNYKLQIKLTIFLLICSGLLYGAVTLQYFTARDIANGVMVEWKTGSEGGVQKV